MDPQLKALLTVPLTISVTTGSVDMYGQPVVGVQKTVMAYIQRVDKEFAGADGNVHRTSHMVIIDASAATPTLQAQVRFPGETTPRNPHVVEAWYDVSKPHGPLSYWQLYL